MRLSLYSVQGLPPGKISIMARPRGGDWLLDEAKALREAGVDVLVSFLTAEEEREFDLSEEAECCDQQGIIFLAFPILDRSVPPFSACAGYLGHPFGKIENKQTSAQWRGREMLQRAGRKTTSSPSAWKETRGRQTATGILRWLAHFVHISSSSLAQMPSAV